MVSLNKAFAFCPKQLGEKYPPRGTDISLTDKKNVLKQIVKRFLAFFLITTKTTIL